MFLIIRIVKVALISSFFIEVRNFIEEYKIEGIIQFNYYDDDFWNYEITWLECMKYIHNFT